MEDCRSHSVERGNTGRICKLKIVGTEKTLIIGKDWKYAVHSLLPTLFSSAFIVEKEKRMPKEYLHGSNLLVPDGDMV